MPVLSFEAAWKQPRVITGVKLGAARGRPNGFS